MTNKYIKMQNNFLVVCLVLSAFVLTITSHAQETSVENAPSSQFDDFVLGIHEVELKEDVSSKDFEYFVREKFAPSWPEFRNGLRIVVLKSDRGERNKKYAIAFLSHSLDARDTLFPNQRPGQQYRAALAPSLAQWQELKEFLAKGPGQVPYQSYHVIPTSQDVAADAQEPEEEPEQKESVSSSGESTRLGFGGFSPRPLQQGSQELRAISPITTDGDVRRILAQDDNDKDGKLGEGDNVRIILKRSFARFDTNSDGFLDASEIKATGLRPHGGAVFLEAFDKDGDGFLTKEEAIYGPLAEGFERYDSDNDGKLAETEMDSFRGGRLSGSRGSGPGRGFRGNGASFEQTTMNRFDGNDDGKLSKEELSNARLFAESFDKLDTDGDEFLSSEELGRFREVAFSSRGPGGRRDPFADSDADGNGTLSKDEVSASGVDFASADADQNGKLSREEFTNGQRVLFASRMFQRIDLDGDGKLREDELDEGRVPRMVVDNFEEVDEDKDGVLTEGEFAKAFRNMRARGERTTFNFSGADRDRDGKLSREEAGHPTLSANFKRYDTDEDGYLSKVEHAALMEGTAEERAMGAARAMIDRVDSNGDGQLTESEFSSIPFLRYDFLDVDRDGNGSLTVEEYGNFLFSLSNPEAAVKKSFAGMDKNADGQITKDEATDIWQLVAAYDTNKNGTITEVEYTLGEGKRKHSADVRRAGQRLLGVGIKNAETGLSIFRVTPGSPADDARIRAGDMLLSIGGESVGSLDDVRKLVNEGPDQKILKLIRDGEEVEITVKFPTE